MLFERQKVLLGLLDALGGAVGSLDFQKLLFLYCQEESVPSYEFVPYKFGGFSFTSYADKRKLVEHGLLADEERRWTLTPAGRQACALPAVSRLAFGRFAQRYEGLRGDALVTEAYRRFPYHAIYSEMSDRLLADDPPAMRAIEAARPVRARPGIATIGYEGLSLEHYLNILLRAGVTLLCDVRKNPLSRKYGFSKTTLANGCAGVGIRYEHLPALGIASDQRKHLDTQADYDALFARYEHETLPGQLAHLDTIRRWVDEGECVALTCYEHEPRQCHRRSVAVALERRFGEHFKPTHL